jgi:hypothetical protein
MLIDRRIAGGAALGVTLAVGTLVGATAFSQNDQASTALSAPAGSRTLLTGSDALALGCRPDEAAVVQHFTFQGERGLNSQCVVVTTPWAAAATPAQLVDSPAMVAEPVRSPARSTAATTVSRARQVDGSSGRTWKKTALVIGGSTAAGAGIGGLIGGKKGALIGSAIGGGSSTIYEAMKRR